MRRFLAICLMSAVVHVALVLAVATPYQRQTAHGETMQVELVPSNEAPAFAENSNETPDNSTQKAQPPKPEAMPDFSKLRLSDTPQMPQDDQKQALQKPAAPPQPEQKQQAQQQQQQAQQQAQQQQAQQQQGQRAQGQQSAQQQPAPSPQQQSMLQQMMPTPSAAETPQELPEQPKMAPEMAVETPADQYERLAALMNIPGAGPTGYGSTAETKARLTDEEIARFKAHLKTCWKLPAGVSNSEKVKVIIRIALRPDGVLADNPSLIEAAASELGLPIYKSAVAALKQCAPYNMLPVEKYKEWRVLDINFSPDEMARG